LASSRRASCLRDARSRPPSMRSAGGCNTETGGSRGNSQQLRPFGGFGGSALQAVDESKQSVATSLRRVEFKEPPQNQRILFEFQSVAASLRCGGSNEAPLSRRGEPIPGSLQTQRTEYIAANGQTPSTRARSHCFG
jgi:hypothetical protein